MNGNVYPVRAMGEACDGVGWARVLGMSGPGCACWLLDVDVDAGGLVLLPVVFVAVLVLGVDGAGDDWD